MSDGRAVTIIDPRDYDLIEAAVMETERGRWFLREYARRNRNADTQMLLGAIEKLEKVVTGERIAQDVDRLRLGLREMATAIARTKSEVSAIHAVEQQHSHLFVASEALDAITRQTEQATSDILAAAEHVQEAAWTLREQGADPVLCDDLDRRATEIYTACSFQDLTAQRIARIIQTLRYLEGRIDAMMAAWDGEIPAAAETAGEPGLDVLSQSDIDGVIVDEDIFGESAAAAGPGETVPEEPAEAEFTEVPDPDPVPAAQKGANLQAFAEIDGLPTREKLRLFT